MASFCVNMIKDHDILFLSDYIPLISFNNV